MPKKKSGKVNYAGSAFSKMLVPSTRGFCVSLRDEREAEASRNGGSGGANAIALQIDATPRNPVVPASHRSRRLERPQLLTPDVATLDRADPHAAFLVWAFQHEQCAL